jgi:3-dehydroquinate synthase
MTNIDVGEEPRGYRIHVGYGLLERLGSVLDEAGIGAQRFAVSSPNVWRHQGPTILAATPTGEPILVPDGERFKRLQAVARIYDALLQRNADRSAVILAVGGGVIGDMAGFAAATYLRGVPHVQVPTTLLGQVDSSIGGKVGVNHPLGKNLIGAFHPPALVVVDPKALRTLPRREFRAGLYEVVKYGVIASASLFDTLSRQLAGVFARQPDVLLPIIIECCQIKARVVTADERESGLRRMLNFGHTAGHALEGVTGYQRFRHGEAIAYGMLVAAELSTARGLLSPGERDALAQLIAQMGPLPPVSDLSVRETLALVKRDKKIVAGQLHFVLAAGIGSTRTVGDVTETELGAALNKIGLRRK